jgi:aerobic-type carbon monoxide dehydrogenase small subunit (CoxS/CutS family)
MNVTIDLTVNGRPARVDAKAHWTLLQLLRDGLFMNGTEEGCGEGSCGSCTVIVDGELTRACLYLAIRAEGREVVTVEGLASGEVLHPVQQAFVERGAIQCGFCTPGMIMSSVALLSENADPSEEEIREHLSGNFCRCGGYTLIFDAVKVAAARQRESRDA